MATVPSYRTWVAGEVVVASYFNSNVRDAGNFWLARPLAILRQTVAQALTNSTFTDILFDTEDIDRDGGHSTVTNTARYTSPTPGYLMFNGGVGYAVNATGNRGTQWCLNASAINAGETLQAAISTNGQPLPARNMFIPVNGSTDFVTVRGFQTSGGSLNTEITSAFQSYMTVLWISTL